MYGTELTDPPHIPSKGARDEGGLPTHCLRSHRDSALHTHVCLRYYARGNQATLCQLGTRPLKVLPS